MKRSLPGPLDFLPMGHGVQLILRLLMSCGLSTLTSCALARETGHGRETQPGPPPQYLPVTARWCLGAPESSSGPARLQGEAESDACILLEAPTSPQQFSWGLQLRPPLPPLRGMWFNFKKPTRTRFWMHRTPAPLDMIFLREGRVIAIEAEVPPCMTLPCPTYGPDERSDGVVELGAGQANTLGIQVGSAAAIEPTSLPPANSQSIPTSPIRGR